MADRAAKYRKLSALEHVTARPGMYVGSVAPTSATLWLAEVGEGGAVALRCAPVAYVPALYKLYDEVVSNALDASVKDATVKHIAVTIGARALGVRNDGAGIPVEVHPATGLYVPQLIFSELHAGENFSEDEERLVAGQNGLGVKLCNIFSQRFQVAVRDAQTGSTWDCHWSDGMTKMATPALKLKSKPAPGFVEVSFEPLPLMLQPTGDVSPQVQALLAKRAVDVALAARAGVRVSVNGVKLPEMTLKRYAQLHVGGDAFLAVDEQEGWRVALAAAPGGGFVSGLVNGVSALGAHVDHVERRLYSALGEAVKGKRDFKDVELKPAMLRARFALFVVASVNKPSFDSQTKERCVSYEARAYTPSDAFVKKIAGCDAIAALAEAERARQDKKAAAKTDGRKSASVSVPKLMDAVWAGTARSAECTLILTEGDSAKAFAVAGLSVLGHDKYGVFPLKGKLLNCREATSKQLSENTEIRNLKTIIGLRAAETHAGGAGLRYGSIISLTDADVDGSHISGLLITFIHHGWPALATSGFIRTLPTPLIRVTKGMGVKDFFTTTAFDEWNAGSPTGWRVRYYKGLGSWGSLEAKEIFRTVKPARFLDSPDSEDRLLLGFEKKRVDDRKAWIQACTASPPPPIDYTHDVTIADFIDQDLVHYAVYSVHRAIPSVCDGLKPSQRKVMFTTFERGYTSPAKLIKVAQLAGAVAEKTLYTHGEASVNEAIICMSQSFAGSNNAPLLYGDGQFGTRLENGKDAASPRYIFCCAAPLARRVFCAADDAVLTYATEEGQQIEPEVYWPVVPMILVNGAAGIATGYSTDIPQHALEDVKANVLRFLAGEPFALMVPHFTGFKGAVTPLDGGKYSVQGVYERRGDIFVVTELPPNGKSYSAYADWASDSETSRVRLLKNKCTDTECYFELQFIEGVPENPAVALKLVTTLNTGNMHAFDTAGAIRKYGTINDILAEWCAWRLVKYGIRLEHLVRTLSLEADELESRARFVRAVTSKKLVLSDFEEGALVKSLAEKGFLVPDKLVNMPAKSFTADRAAAIERAAVEARVAAVRAAAVTPKGAWENDLREL
jgi:DNA topoisomerase-2